MDLPLYQPPRIGHDRVGVTIEPKGRVGNADDHMRCGRDPEPRQNHAKLARRAPLQRLLRRSINHADPSALRGVRGCGRATDLVQAEHYRCTLKFREIEF
jgi:hypothetical protein